MRRDSHLSHENLARLKRFSTSAIESHERYASSVVAMTKRPMTKRGSPFKIIFTPEYGAFVMVNVFANEPENLPETPRLPLPDREVGRVPLVQLKDGTVRFWAPEFRSTASYLPTNRAAILPKSITLSTSSAYPTSKRRSSTTNQSEKSSTST